MPYLFSSLEQISGANIASVRLRAGSLPGHLQHTAWDLSVGEAIDPAAGVCVVGKIGAHDIAARNPRWVAELRRAKKNGCKIILDYTDNHLYVATQMSGFYAEALAYADMCVCSSMHLKRSLSTRFPDVDRIEVIPDAIEVGITAPKTEVSRPVTMLWFGHASNLGYLMDLLSDFSIHDNLRLLILTNIEGIDLLKKNGFRPPTNIIGSASVWSVEAMLDAAKISDLCIIPSDPADLRKSGASANRLITALAMGLPTAASLLDSYAEHREYFVDIESDQFLEMLKAPLNFSAQVRAAQALVVPGFAPDVLAASWISLFERAQLA